jgi:hypothetical protein
MQTFIILGPGAFLDTRVHFGRLPFNCLDTDLSAASFTGHYLGSVHKDHTGDHLTGMQDRYSRDTDIYKNISNISLSVARYHRGIRATDITGGTVINLFNMWTGGRPKNDRVFVLLLIVASLPHYKSWKGEWGKFSFFFRYTTCCCPAGQEHVPGGFFVVFVVISRTCL